MRISLEELDALQECLNIGVGRAAGSLNTMLDKPIRLHIPFIKLGSIDELSKQLPINEEASLSSVQLPFQGPFAGSACLLFPTDSAAALVTALNRRDKRCGHLEFTERSHAHRNRQYCLERRDGITRQCIEYTDYLSRSVL